MNIGTRTWPLTATVCLSDLGPLGDPVSEGGGESKGIYPLTAHPGWLAKLYKTAADAERTSNLDQLVALADSATEHDHATITAGTSWPVARIGVDEYALGCVMPAAPEKFRSGFASGRFLEIDWLLNSDEALTRRALPVPTATQRLLAGRNIVDVASLLERHGLIYSDWSYSNAFWSRTDHAVFVIDIDGCGPVSVPDIHQPGWEDERPSESNRADVFTDRYRVGMLLARCLTGERNRDDAIHALAGSEAVDSTALREILLDILLSDDRTRRPSLTLLGDVLRGSPYIRFRPVPVRMPMPEVVRRQDPAVSTTAPVDPAETPGGNGTPDPTPSSATRDLVFAVLTILIFFAIVIVLGVMNMR